jgi:hypothetical protein
MPRNVSTSGCVGRGQFWHLNVQLRYMHPAGKNSNHAIVISGGLPESFFHNLHFSSEEIRPQSGSCSCSCWVICHTAQRCCFVILHCCNSRAVVMSSSVVPSCFRLLSQRIRASSSRFHSNYSNDHAEFVGYAWRCSL